jgi:hypothetical protein
VKRAVVCIGPSTGVLAAPILLDRRRLDTVVAELEGEAVAGDGHEGIPSVFVERGREGGAMAFVGFDVLQLTGQGRSLEP